MKQNRVPTKTIEDLTPPASKDISQEEAEAALGRKMHEIGKEQAVLQASQKRLQELQDQANLIDTELTKLDVGRNHT